MLAVRDYVREALLTVCEWARLLSGGVTAIMTATIAATTVSRRSISYYLFRFRLLDYGEFPESETR